MLHAAPKPLFECQPADLETSLARLCDAVIKRRIVDRDHRGWTQRAHRECTAKRPEMASTVVSHDNCGDASALQCLRTFTHTQHGLSAREPDRQPDARTDW